jgi:hypothetical protein
MLVGAQQNQEYMEHSQNNMQRGRSVETQNIPIQPFSQMMAASNTYQRRGIEHTTVAANEKGARTITLTSEDMNNIRAQTMITNIKDEIEKRDFHGDNPLSACIFDLKYSENIFSSL